MYYAATFVEATLCGAEEVIVVDGGNSAGQAAVFLARHAAHVHLLVRADGLQNSMSRYPIKRIEETPNITFRSRTEVIALERGDHLERVRWRDSRAPEAEIHPIRHVFLMTGATPHTHWLESCVVPEENRYIKTGPALTPEELQEAHWPLARSPYLLETSLPGVFA
ncbi:MAG: NAD(P)/FAD-dependent oxidoreductase, partial [Gammaproteobacteria bacterium]|nr:NAD(P)/FAD-dependent oxidoreductase [Gammaproteobacteria bacterium]